VSGNSSWLAATGQTWKVYVLYFLTAVAVLSVVGGLVSPVSRLLSHDRELFLTLTPAVGALWIGWIAFAFRCPSCGSRTGRWYLRNSALTEWFTALVCARQCPICGSDGGAPRKGF
jgi:hypothetical protein